METKIILPVLETEKLQEYANKAAMAGAMKSIDEYYNGYGSPFRKVIDEELKKYKIGFGLELPDIIALINESLSKEIDTVANAAVAKTFVPLVKRFLTREEKEVDFSELLKEFIKSSDSDDPYDFSADVTESSYGWLDVRLYYKDKETRLTLHDARNEGEKKYHILSLPYGYEDVRGIEKMKISLDGATLEMPFTRDVLKNEFTSLVARLIISGSLITMDCRDFNEDHFPEDECHC